MSQTIEPKNVFQKKYFQY